MLLNLVRKAVAILTRRKAANAVQVSLSAPPELGARPLPAVSRPSKLARQITAAGRIASAAELGMHERVAILVDVVGGMAAAARLAGVTNDTVNNWRKPGAKLPVQGMLPLCQAAQVSLDWLATGRSCGCDVAESAISGTRRREGRS